MVKRWNTHSHRGLAKSSEGTYSMTLDIASNPRLDPRVKALLANMPAFAAGDAASRDELLAEVGTGAAQASVDMYRAMMEICDVDEIAPSAGLRVSTEKIVSQPDGNEINLQIIRPDIDEVLSCVYYIHGGGNRTLAVGLKLKRDQELGLVKGLYALCPYIAGEWPLASNPSSTENNGILLELHNNRGAHAYGIGAFNARDPLAVLPVSVRARCSECFAAFAAKRTNR